MKKLVYFAMILFVLCNIAFGEKWVIDYGNVSDPLRLQTLLVNRFDLVEVDIQNLKSQINLGTVALSTTVAIDNDAAGTSYRFVGATGILTPVTAGAVIIDPVTTADCEFLVPIGNINFLGSAAQTGVIKWYMTYKPLSPNSVVIASP